MNRRDLLTGALAAAAAATIPIPSITIADMTAGTKFTSLWFDEAACAEGILRLREYCLQEIYDITSISDAALGVGL